MAFPFCSPVPAARPLTFRVLVHVLATVHPKDDGRPRPHRVTETGGALRGSVGHSAGNAFTSQGPPGAPLVVGDNLAEATEPFETAFDKQAATRANSGTPRYQGVVCSAKASSVAGRYGSRNAGSNRAKMRRPRTAKGTVIRALGFQSCMTSTRFLSSETCEAQLSLCCASLSRAARTTASAASGPAGTSGARCAPCPSSCIARARAGTTSLTATRPCAWIAGTTLLCCFIVARALVFFVRLSYGRSAHETCGERE